MTNTQSQAHLQNSRTLYQRVTLAEFVARAASNAAYAASLARGLPREEAAAVAAAAAKSAAAAVVCGYQQTKAGEPRTVNEAI